MWIAFHMGVVPVWFRCGAVALPSNYRGNKVTGGRRYRGVASRNAPNPKALTPQTHPGAQRSARPAVRAIHATGGGFTDGLRNLLWRHRPIELVRRQPVGNEETDQPAGGGVRAQRRPGWRRRVPHRAGGQDAIRQPRLALEQKTADCLANSQEHELRGSPASSAHTTWRRPRKLSAARHWFGRLGFRECVSPPQPPWRTSRPGPCS